MLSRNRSCIGRMVNRTKACLCRSIVVYLSTETRVAFTTVIASEKINNHNANQSIHIR